MMCRGKQKEKKEWKKELTKERKADNIYQVVSRTHQTISNLVRFVEKIEKKVLTRSWWRGNI